MVRVLHLRKGGSTSTDMALMVNTAAQQDQYPWDKKRIIDALRRETDVTLKVAHEIADEVEKQVFNSESTLVTTSLIRELVSVSLFKRGLMKVREQQSAVGMPLYDVDRLIFDSNSENSNIYHNPESINLSMAEIILKEYALQRVFSNDIAQAHLKGDIHVHDLGMVNRPYCSGQSPEYVKKFGIDLPNISSVSKPAKHADVFLGHLLKMTSVLQNHFAGAIGWDAINMFFAPYLEGLSDEKIRQLAQQMIFEFNQLAGGRGGQVAFTDVNVYWEIPEHYADVPAIGPGGKFTGKKYRDYEKLSQKFANAMVDVYMQGDAHGAPFFFPKPLVHITEKFFRTAGHEEFLLRISKLAVEKGNTYFVFDRGEVVKLSECCRLSFELSPDDLAEAKEPWKLRFSALQNVTVNLPRAAYKAEGSVPALFKEIDRLLEISALAHKEKKNFIERILSLGKKSPLATLLIDHDGQPYLKLKKCAYLFGLIGLNETVQAMIGKQMHEGMDAYRLGMLIISHINLKVRELGKEMGMKFVLEQTPAESTTYRLAKLDMRYFPEQTAKVIKGNQAKGEIYYTNSTFYANGAPVSFVERIVGEGKMHPLITAGAITHVWLGEHKPPEANVAEVVKKTFLESSSAQIAFSPEFTVCSDCDKMSRGLHDKCPKCGSKKVDGITRITGYFSKTSSWNKGKRAELRERSKAAV